MAIYDLDERTLVFAVEIINLSRDISKRYYLKDCWMKDITRQLVRSSCSVGANYREACAANSTKEKILRIGICRKESRESEYWLDLIWSVTCRDIYTEKIALLKEESIQISKILYTIQKKLEIPRIVP